MLGPSGCGKTTTLRAVSRPGEADHGRHPHRRHAGQRPAARRTRHRHGVPVLRPLPAPENPRQPGLPPAGRGTAQGGGAGAGRGGRPADAARSAPGPATPPAVRRGAAARRARPRPGAPTARLPHGRTPHQPGRGTAGGHAHGDQAPPGELGTTMVYVTHDQVEAMSLGHQDRHPQQGPRRADRHAAGGLRPPGQSLLRRVHRLPADEPDRGGGGRREAAQQGRTGPHAPAGPAARPFASIAGVRPEALESHRTRGRTVRSRPASSRRSGWATRSSTWSTTATSATYGFACR